MFLAAQVLSVVRWLTVINSRYCLPRHPLDTYRALSGPDLFLPTHNPGTLSSLPLALADLPLSARPPRLHRFFLEQRRRAPRTERPVKELGLYHDGGWGGEARAGSTVA